MNVTYLLSPTSNYIIHTNASNVLSENLLRDERIEVHFNRTLITLVESARKLKENVKGLLTDGSSISVFCKYSATIERTYSLLCSFYFFDRIESTIKTDKVLITCWNPFSLPFIKYLLNKGYKVVIGGVLCNSYSFDFIRNLLKKIGTNNLENLIIVKGYVDLTTDLYSIIKNGKDTVIEKNDFSTIWECEKDYIKQTLKIVKKYRKNPTWYTVVFNNQCWYNKCTFCNIYSSPKLNFIGSVSDETLYRNISRNMKQYKTDCLFVNDPYLVFTDKTKKLFTRLRKGGKKIAIQTGITLLKDKDYLKDINEYVDEIRIGLESCSDFSLQYINKGYRWIDVKESMNQMIKYLRKDIALRYLYIMDLVATDRRDIIRNYTKIFVLKMKLFENGFENFLYFPRNLHLFPDVRMSKKTKFLEICSSDDNRLSGIWKIYRYLDIFINIEVPEEIVLPYKRFDMDGNVLPSDYHIINSDLMKEIVE